MIEQICLNKDLIESAKEVFETMVFMDMEEIEDPQSKVEGEALLGLITFTGDLQGCLGICCSIACARAIAMNMLGIDSPNDLSKEDTCDAMGEIANMVMGSLKTRLLEHFGNLEVSIPSTVTGKELNNNLGENAQKILIKCNIEDEYVTEFMLLYRENPSK